MAEYLIKEETLRDIADTIRAKKESVDKISVKDFATELKAIDTGFDYVNHEVTIIPDNAFSGSKKLTSIDCSNLMSIGANAFKDCVKLNSAILYEGLSAVGENAFKGCDNVIIYCKTEDLTSNFHENWNPDDRPVMYGELIETWDISASDKDSVTAELYLDNENYSLFIYGNGTMSYFNGVDCFPWNIYCSSIARIVIADGVASISNSAFSHCTSLTNIAIPDSIVTIGEHAFFCCTHLVGVTIPNGVTTIDMSVFCACYRLVSVDIPKSVVSIGNNSFDLCYDLATVTYAGTIAQWQAIAFGTNWNQSTGNYTIHCTDGDIAKDGTITDHNA